MLTTPFVSRLVAILLLLTVVAAVYLHVMDPMIAAYADVEDRLVESRKLIQHFDRLAVRGPVYASRLAALESEDRAKGYYLAGDTDALAAANLQDRLTRLIDANSGVLRSLQPMPGSDEHGFRRIAVRVSIAATTEMLVRTLRDIEAGLPVLFIDNVEIRTDTASDGGSGIDGVSWNGEPGLAVAFEVYGYLPEEAN